YMVEVTLESIFARPLSLAELRNVAALAKMELLRKGSRLSVQPVRPAEFARICKLGQSTA
ncbi:MAG: EVE domain-containing protein, partial [Pirellulaceae bacterium]